MPYVKVGGYVRLLPADLRELLARDSVEPVFFRDRRRGPRRAAS